MVGPLRTQEAEDLLRHCLEAGHVIPGKHFREELTKEKVTFQDAMGVLRKGSIYDPPEHDVRSGEWKYRVEGHEPDGKWLVIVFSFKAVDTAFLITVFSVQSKGKQS